MNIAPGLNGLLAQRQFAQQEQQGQLGQIQGLLGIQNAMQDQQLNPLKLEQLKLQLDNQRRNALMVNGLLGEQGGGAGGTPMEGGISLPGSSGQIPQSSGGVSQGGIPRNVQAMILSGDAGLGKLGGIMAENYKPTDKMREAIALGFQPGTPAFNSFVGRTATQGGIWDTNPNGGVSLAGGYATGMGAVKDAEEAARARLDIVKIPDGKGGEISLPRDIAIQMLQGNRQNAPQQAPAPSMAPTPFAPQGQQVNPNDPLLASGLNPQQVSSMRSMDAAGLPFNTTVPGLQPRVSQPAPAIPAPIPTSNVVGNMGTTKPKLADTLSPGQKAVDDAFAKDYSEFVTGGLQADQAANVAKMGDALNSLRSGSIQLGAQYKVMPESALAVVNPKLLDLKQNVGAIVQRGLRPILGAQFTEKEGENLINRAFDPGLSAGANAYRLGMLEKTMAAALESKQAAVKYYEENGTLAGFKGKVYTPADFRNMSFEIKPSKQITLDDGSKVLAKFDESAGKYSVTKNGKKYFVEGE